MEVYRGRPYPGITSYGYYEARMQQKKWVNSRVQSASEVVNHTEEHVGAGKVQRLHHVQ